jgi:hypothetical protein
MIKDTPQQLKNLAIGTGFERNIVTRKLLVQRVKKPPLEKQTRLAREMIDQRGRSDEKEKQSAYVLLRGDQLDSPLTSRKVYLSCPRI